MRSIDKALKTLDAARPLSTMGIEREFKEVCERGKANLQKFYEKKKGTKMGQNSLWFRSELGQIGSDAKFTIIYTYEEIQKIGEKYARLMEEETKKFIMDHVGY